MSTRTKSLGVAAAFAAMVVAVPTTFQAYAEPTPSPSPAPAAESSPAAPAPAAESSPAAPAPAAESSPAAPAPAAESSPAPPAPASTTVPVPTSTKVPDPQGPGCDAYRKANPAGSPGSIESMALQTGSQALASNPELSTFSDAISGKLNPAINIVNVLDGGPYVVFAPTNAAFAKLDAATLDTLKTDPVVLLPTLFYHMVLGYLGPNDVQGKMPTQDGRSVTVTGKGSEVKVNDVPVTCAFATRGAYVYMIDEVLTPPTPAAEAGEATTPTTTPTTTASPTTASPTTTAAPTTTASPTASPTTTAASPAEQTATPATTPSAAATPTTTKAAA